MSLPEHINEPATTDLEAARAFAAAPKNGPAPIDAAAASTPRQVPDRRVPVWSNTNYAPTPSLSEAMITSLENFDENDPAATFEVINGQEIASAARTDKRDYRSRDPRCTPGEGPIPVECRAASCGTCWVGVLGGAEKLSPVVDRDERRRMAVLLEPARC